MTRPRIVFMATILVALLAAPQSSEPRPVAGQTPPEVKGWRGAEWGMTPDQVATALSRPLGERERSKNAGEADVFFHRIRNVPVGDWTAVVTVLFQEPEGGAQAKLFRVTLEWMGVRDFRKVRDELKATYGPPTSETKNLSLGRTEARWILPLTQIDCSLFEVSDKAFMTVRFQEHKRAF